MESIQYEHVRHALTEAKRLWLTVEATVWKFDDETYVVVGKVLSLTENHVEVLESDKIHKISLNLDLLGLKVQKLAEA